MVTKQLINPYKMALEINPCIRCKEKNAYQNLRNSYFLGFFFYKKPLAFSTKTMYDIKVNYISISVTFRHIFPTEHLKFIQIKGEQFELSGISM